MTDARWGKEKAEKIVGRREVGKLNAQRISMWTVLMSATRTSVQYEFQGNKDQSSVTKMDLNG